MFEGTTEKIKWLGLGEKSQQDQEAASAWGLEPKGASGPYSEPITPVGDYFGVVVGWEYGEGYRVN